jgi:hypothetical protein
MHALTAPTTQPDGAPAPALTAEQQKAQDTIERHDYLAMLRSCLPTLRAEVLAAEFMEAELTRSRDVQVKKRRFLKAAGKITGGLPPMTDAALSVIRMSPKA